MNYLDSVGDYEAAESAVIGSLILDPLTAMHQVIDQITEKDFYSVWKGQLFDLICHMWADGNPIDPLTVYAAAREQEVHIPSEAAGIHDLVTGTPTAANAGYYARQVAENGARRRLHQTGVRLQQIAATAGDWGEKMTYARIEWESVQNQTSGKLEARTMGEILQGSDEYDWLIPDLLERQDRLILTGGEGAGKSTMIRQFAICASAGIHPFTHQQIEPVRVLVIDVENSEKQWRRACRSMVAKAQELGSEDPAQVLRLATGQVNLSSERDVGAVHRLIDEHKPDMLFIGPIYKLVPKAITNDDDAAPLLATLETFRRRDVALIIEGHAPKADAYGVRNLAPRGSAALQGWPEFGLGLKLMENEYPRTAEVVHWRGDRDLGRGWPSRVRAGGKFPWTDDALEPEGDELRGVWVPSWDRQL